jgi:hypothetical protein
MRARTNASTPAVDDDARDIIVTTAATGARVDLTLSSVRSVSPEAEVGVRGAASSDGRATKVFFIPYCSFNI